MRQSVFLTTLVLLPLVLVVLAGCFSTVADDQAPARRIDPSAWGGDHVGKPFPTYITGDECLFCHRKIGPGWTENRHQLTIRPAVSDEPAIRALRELAGGKKLAADAKYLLGTKDVLRFLRRSKQYGKMEILSSVFIPDKKVADDGEAAIGKLKRVDSPHWDTTTFGRRCAGCHTTAVDVQTQAFSAISLDCFTCHGDVPLDHTKDVSLALLSNKNRDPRKTISICGQCHLRGGKSKSSGLPYPNTFVAGDNLFRDFQVSLSDESIEALPAVEQHIFLNARDVAVFGNQGNDLFNLPRHSRAGQREAPERRQRCDMLFVPCASNRQFPVARRAAPGKQIAGCQSDLRRLIRGRSTVTEFDLEKPLDGAPPDETDISLRAYFTRFSDERLREYNAAWSDEQVIEWDGNFRCDGALMLVCCERDIEIDEYRRVLREQIRRRGVAAKG